MTLPPDPTGPMAAATPNTPTPDDRLREDMSDDMLMALADDELDPTTTARLLAQVARDPDLAARYAMFVETRALVAGAYAAGPVPDRLIRSVLEAPRKAAVIPMRARRPGWAGAPALALAASLVMAVGVGAFFVGKGAAPGPQATPALAAATLGATPTGGTVVLPDGSTARALATYQTNLGLCRLIGMAGPAAQTAVVCRRDGGWVTALAVGTGDGTSFAPASEVATGVIDRLLDDIAAGPALSPQEEASALAP